MLATFAFDVCHDVYRAAREAIDTKIPTLNSEACGKYMWHPDRMPRLAEYVCDFERAGERALGGADGGSKGNGRGSGKFRGNCGDDCKGDCKGKFKGRQAEACPTVRASPSQGQLRASRMALFRVYYLGGAEYQAARRHLGISEITWGDWAEEIRECVGRELTRAGMFPPSKYFLEATARAS